MSDSRKKSEEIEESQSNTGLGRFTQTTTQDEFIDFEKLYMDGGGFEKDDKTLLRDMLDEFSNWNEHWKYWSYYGGEKPTDADEFAEVLSQKYQIKLK